MMSELIYKEGVYAIVGAVMAVYNVLGFGFLEAVYHEALVIEFADRGVPYVSKALLQIQFKRKPLKKKCEADLLTYEKIAAELKAIGTLTSDDVLNY